MADKSTTELNLLLTAKNSMQKDLDSAKKGVQGLGSAFSSMAKIAGGFVMAQGILKAPGVLKGFVDAASDMNETLSKSNTVFKANAKEIETWANGAARDFGLSKRQALDAASGFGNMFSQLGIGSTKAAAMSKSIVELAADFASFHNADISQVLDAQSAAFRGEYDSLQRFLPLINAATVEQEAMAMTGKKTNKELTAQEKALAVNSLMLKGAGEAMGDFDRTNAGLANRMRILGARFDDIKVNIGQKFLPIVVTMAGFLLDKVLPAVGNVAGAFDNLRKYIGFVITDGDSMNDWLTHVPGFAQPAVKVIGDLIVKFQELPLAVQTGINPIAAVALNLDTFRQKALDVVANVTELRRLFMLGFDGGKIGGDFSFMEKAAFNLGVVWKQNLIPAFNDAKEAVRLFLLVIQGGQAGGQFSALQQSAIDLGVSIRKMWVEDIKPALTDLQLLAAQVIQFIRDHWPEIKDAAEIVAKIWAEHMRGMVLDVMSILDAVANVIQLVSALFHGDWQKMWDEAKQIVGFFADELDDIFFGIPGKLWDVGKLIIGGLIGGIKSMFNDVKDTLGDLTSKITSWKGPPSTDRVLLHPAGVMIMEGLSKGLADGATTFVAPVLQKITAMVQKSVIADTKTLQSRYELRASGENALVVNDNGKWVSPATYAANHGLPLSAMHESGGVVTVSGSAGSGSGGRTLQSQYMPNPRNPSHQELVVNDGGKWVSPATYAANHGIPLSAMHESGGVVTVVGYAKGTPFVPNDGLAYLHRGEAVIPANQNRGGLTVNVYNAGAVMSERELIRVIRDAAVSGSFQGVLASA